MNPDNRREAARIVRAASQIGYKRIGIDSKVYDSSLKNLESIDVYPVVRIESSSISEAKKVVRENSGKIIFARAKDAGSLRFFSRDSRVWVVELTPRLTKLFDRDEARLLKQGQSIVGINLSIAKKKSLMLGWIQNIIGRSLKYGLRTIVYSGAERVEELWPPLSLLYLLKSMKLTKNMAITMISNWPLRRVK